VAVVRGGAGNGCCVRYASASPVRLEKPSSKIEETVQHLKEGKPEKSAGNAQREVL
jgi:hypothetical protein